MAKLFSKSAHKPGAEMSFFDHIEALRWHLVRSVIAIVVIAIALFCYRDLVFDDIIFASKHGDFWTYRMLCRLSEALHLEQGLCVTQVPFELINTDLSGQFTMHIWVSLVGGFILALPYVLWELWRFIKPALKQNEKKYTTGIVFYTSVLFICGVLFGYYGIVPLSVNFLASYQVSPEVKNMIQMDSFISTVTTLTLASGLIFELPVVIYFLSKIGFVTPEFLRRYRKHSVVVILIVAAVITPSPDVTSQLLVAFPLYLLYEVSIYVSAYVHKKKEETV